MDRETYWRNHLMAQQRSGLRQTEYCLREKLKLSSFNYWARRIKNKREPAGKFVAITGSTELEVRVGQAVIRVPAGSDLTEVRRLVEALSC
jgi:hypothetical protein